VIKQAISIRDAGKREQFKIRQKIPGRDDFQGFR
jgi:hypothetical protein